MKMAVVPVKWCCSQYGLLSHEGPYSIGHDEDNFFAKIHARHLITVVAAVRRSKGIFNPRDVASLRFRTKSTFFG
jgi:hypothetical protein